MDANQTISGVATVGELIDANSARHRFNMILLLWFGICAAILAASGVYGVVAETLAARRHEVAIKNALGAQRIRLVREMLVGALSFILVGEAIGVMAVFTMGRFAADLWYGVSPRDPLLLGSVGAFLFVVSLAAAFWPAWTATTTESLYLR
jgi:putative ABC transport system permease protein